MSRWQSFLNSAGTALSTAKEKAGEFTDRASEKFTEVAENTTAYIEQKQKEAAERAALQEANALREAIGTTEANIQTITKLQQQIDTDIETANELLQEIDELNQICIRTINETTNTVEATLAEEALRKHLQDTKAKFANGLTIKSAAAENKRIAQHKQQLEALVSNVKREDTESEETAEKKPTSVQVQRVNMTTQGGMQMIRAAHQRLRIAIAYANAQRFRQLYMMGSVKSLEQIKSFFAEQPGIDKQVISRMVVATKTNRAEDGYDTWKKNCLIPGEQQELYEPIAEYLFSICKINQIAQKIRIRYFEIVQGTAPRDQASEETIEDIKILNKLLGEMAQQHAHLTQRFSATKEPLPNATDLDKSIKSPEVGLISFVLAEISPELQKAQAADYEKQQRELKAATFERLKKTAADLEKGLDELPPFPPASESESTKLNGEFEHDMQVYNSFIQRFKTYVELLKEAHKQLPLKQNKITLAEIESEAHKLEFLLSGFLPEMPALPQPQSEALLETEFDREFDLVKRQIIQQRQYIAVLTKQQKRLPVLRAEKRLANLKAEAAALEQGLDEDARPRMPELSQAIRDTFETEQDQQLDLLRRESRQQETYIEWLNQAHCEKPLKDARKKLAKLKDEVALLEKGLDSQFRPTMPALKKPPRLPTVSGTSPSIAEFIEQSQREHSIEGQLSTVKLEIQQQEDYKDLLTDAHEKQKEARNAEPAIAKLSFGPLKRKKENKPQKRAAATRDQSDDSIAPLTLRPPIETYSQRVSKSVVKDYDTSENRDKYKANPFNKKFSWKKNLAMREKTRDNMVGFIQSIATAKIDDTQKEALLYAALLVVKKSIENENPWYTSVLWCIVDELIDLAPTKDADQKAAVTALQQFWQQPTTKKPEMKKWDATQAMTNLLRT